MRRPGHRGDLIFAPIPIQTLYRASGASGAGRVINVGIADSAGSAS